MGEAVAIEGAIPLPDADGPRLHPFPASHGKQPNIEFLQHLGTGATAHVFKARIDGHVYALKIFKWKKANKLWAQAPQRCLDKVDESLVIAHMHPFYSECRAYGRLKELNKEHLAARCYGYLLFNADQEEALQDKLGPFQWKNEEVMADRDGSPLQVLVKEFIPGKVHFEFKDARRMARNLKALHRIGILVMDIKEDAYLNGILVDFSHARTIPHVKFDPALGFDPYTEGQKSIWADLGNLDEVFEDWNDEPEHSPKINVAVIPKWERLGSLRNKDVDAAGNTDYKFFDPTKFDWRRACRQGEAKKRGRPPSKRTGVKKRGKAVKSAREEISIQKEIKKRQRR